MLSLLASSAVPSQALQPNQPSRLCVSTAVDVKTVECNLDCNLEGATCPDACHCSHASSTSTPVDLSLSMPSRDFKRLLITSSKEDPQLPPTNLLRTLQPANLTLPVSDETTAEAALKKLPNDAVGFFMKTWSCVGNPPRSQDLHTFPCVGPEHKAVNVVFSGFSTLDRALAAAIPALGAEACKKEDKQWCDAQLESMVPWQVPTRKEAIERLTDPNGVFAATCATCLNPPKEDKNSKEWAKHPYSRSVGHPDLNIGLQFLSLGGANRAGAISVDRFKNFEKDLPAVKEAGFHGICFDIELTIGEMELVKEVEKVFATCKKYGMLVMVTTSHSAPYAAASEASKVAFADSWTKSPHIDVFVPQMYSRGRESEPELVETPCVGSDGATVSSHCTYQHMKQMKAIWMPALANSGHYDATKKFFAGMGIHVQGFIQWNRGHGDRDPQ